MSGAQHASKTRREYAHSTSRTRNTGELMTICLVLPFEARNMLVKASLAHPQVRARAIDGAITQIRLMYHQLFR